MSESVAIGYVIEEDDTPTREQFEGIPQSSVLIYGGNIVEEAKKLTKSMIDSQRGLQTHLDIITKIYVQENEILKQKVDNGKVKARNLKN